MLQKKIIGMVEEIRSLFETSTTYDINLKDNASFYECIDGRYPDKYLLIINGRQNLIDFDHKTNKIWESDPVLYYNFTKKILNKRLVQFINVKVSILYQLNHIMTHISILFLISTPLNP